MRAAIAALAHEHPRLGAIATTNMTGQDFGGIAREGDRPQSKTAGHNRCEGGASRFRQVAWLS